MDATCLSVQLALMEVAGDVGQLAHEERVHVEACSECARAASAELGLGRVLAEALPPEGPALEAAVLAALAPRGWRRRVVAALPVAASLGVVALGVMLVGGVPGVGILSLLPAWSSQGWMALAGVAGDWGVAVLATSRAAGAVVPAPAALAAAGLGVAGLWLTVSVVRRWRRSPAWRRRDD